MTAYPGQTLLRTPLGQLCRPIGLQIMAGCDTAWNRTRVCSDAASAEMQCLKPLRHSVALTWKTRVDLQLNEQQCRETISHNDEILRSQV